MVILAARGDELTNDVQNLQVERLAKRKNVARNTALWEVLLSYFLHFLLSFNVHSRVLSFLSALTLGANLPALGGDLA